MRGFERLHPADDFEFRSLRRPADGRPRLSAAATSAGLLAADQSSSSTPTSCLATELEGHPDNVAAALLGGFVLCANGEATRVRPPAGLEAVLVVPGRALRTATAPAALPARCPWRTRCSTSPTRPCSYSGSAGRMDLVARGLTDRLHQPRRAPLYPQSMEMSGRAREFGALGATISGAGPTVLVWTYSSDRGRGRAAAGETADGADRAAGAGQPNGADVRALDCRRTPR